MTYLFVKLINFNLSLPTKPIKLGFMNYYLKLFIFFLLICFPYFTFAEESFTSSFDIIKENEGLRLTAYRDSSTHGKKYCIGYGHTWNVKKGQTISKNKADKLLLYDIIIIRGQIDSLDLILTANQKDALVSFVYNVGITKFVDSKLYKVIKKNPHDKRVKYIMNEWVYCKGKKLNGLVKRRKQEYKLYSTK